MSYLLITVRWLDDRYHGKLDREGPAEWPPSPYRLFQALVAGVARQGELDGDHGQGLAWVQGLDPPTILAPSSQPGTVITRYVPNNDGDKKADRQDRLKGKVVCPTLMLDTPEVHYLWKVDNAEITYARFVSQATRHLTCLGWGVDMAYADGRIIAEAEICSLRGVRWRPRKGVSRDDGMLRTPVDCENDKNRPCTLSDLRHAHQSAMSRIEHGKPLNTVDKPTVFGSVFYESKERLLGRPHVVFELRQNDGNFFRYPQRKLIHIAGMVRCLAIKAMDAKQGSPPTGIANAPEWVETYVAGHAKSGDSKHRQFSYLPLPSIGMTHTDPSVRRVMIAAPLGDDRLLEHLALRLAGQKFRPKRGDEFGDQEPPTLVRVQRDRVARFYTAPANVWASVTPVILPGHDDHKPAKTIKLIEKALRQSGIDQPCTFEWRAASWRPQSFSAHKYDRNRKPAGYFRPKHLLSQTAVHLKLQFNDQANVPGPMVIGAGRHCGFGLMAGFDA